MHDAAALVDHEDTAPQQRIHEARVGAALQGDGVPLVRFGKKSVQCDALLAGTGKQLQQMG